MPNVVYYQYQNNIGSGCLTTVLHVLVNIVQERKFAEIVWQYKVCPDKNPIWVGNQGNYSNTVYILFYSAIWLEENLLNALLMSEQRLTSACFHMLSFNKVTMF